MIESYTRRKSRGQEFAMIFGKQLRRYLHPIFGFDSIQFDADIGTPDGISMHDWIMQNWGKSGVKLIEELIR